MKSTMRLGVLFTTSATMLLLAGCSGRLSSAGRPNTTNKTALRIHQKLEKYADKTQVPWTHLHLDKSLQVGDVSPLVPEIRRRLIVLEDLNQSQASSSQHFGQSLKRAVMLFQWRHGIKQTGVVGPKTLQALNVSPRQRYRDLMVSMNKWAELPEHEGSHYIHVNIPSYKMFLVRDGQRVMDMNVIVGKSSRPTPTLYSKLKTIVFNPTWTVPKTILAKDVIPGMRNNPNYMKEHYNMKLYSSWDKNAAEIDPLTVDWHNATGSNFKYRITAPPGNQNPLGRVKFVFENEHDVYMHDTPSKGLFSQIRRAYSSGCIRLEQPFRLVEYFYPDNSDLDHYRVSEYLSSNQTRYIALKNPIPIQITYITSWVDQFGRIHFREDIYREPEVSKAPETAST